METLLGATHFSRSQHTRSPTRAWSCKRGLCQEELQSKNQSPKKGTRFYLTIHELVSSATEFKVPNPSDPSIRADQAAVLEFNNKLWRQSSRTPSNIVRLSSNPQNSGRKFTREGKKLPLNWWHFIQNRRMLKTLRRRQKNVKAYWREDSRSKCVESRSR